MARTPPVFLNSDAPSHAHAVADAMAPVRRHRIPNFVFTLPLEERVVARFGLDAERTIRRARGGWWRALLWKATHRRDGFGRPWYPLLAVTSYRVLLFTPAPDNSPDPFHDSPYELVEIPLETLVQVRAVDGILAGGEGVLELLTLRGERLVVSHVPDPQAAASLIHSVAAGYLREEREQRPANRPGFELALR